MSSNKCRRYSRLTHTDLLPDYFRPEDGGRIPLDLIGSQIVRIGGCRERRELSGGGLIIDYVPKNHDRTKRAVFEFSELGISLIYCGVLLNAVSKTGSDSVEAHALHQRRAKRSRAPCSDPDTNT